MRLRNTFIGFIAALAALGFATTSCDHEDGPGTAEVKVINKEGLIQKRVKVVLFCTEPECAVRRTGRTNDLGIYTQQFDLPVVLRARAVRYDTTVTLEGLPPNQIKRVKVDSLCGEGFIQIENEQVTSETITILDCI